MKLDTPTIETEILKLLAKLHIVTHDQLYRLLPEFERCHVSAAINLLTNSDYLYVKEYEIPRQGSGIISKKTKMISVLTYALNFKSRPVIYKKFRDLRLSRRENPTGLRYRRRIYHDLLIVEALLYLHDRYEIAEITNEEFLQRTKQTMADLRIKVDEGAGNFSFIDVEIVVSNTNKDILNKPDSSLFFTYSSYKADIIYKLKGFNAIVLNINGDEIKQPKDDFSSDRYDHLYEYIHELNLRCEALTAPALAVSMEKDEVKTAAVLRELEENGFLFADYAHINLCSDKGKRTRIYATNRSVLKERCDRVLSLMCSRLIVNQKEKSFFCNLDWGKRIAKFRASEDTFALYYLDNPDKSVLENLIEFKILTAELKNNKTELLYMFASNRRKLEAFYLQNTFEF